MTRSRVTNASESSINTARWPGAIALVLVGAGSALAGCINVSAPEKPIEINLNVNVTQEVVYRLDNEAKTLIQDNPGIF